MIKKKKILLLSCDYSPYKDGGLVRYSENIVKNIIINKSYDYTLAVGIPRDNKLIKLKKLKTINIPLSFYNSFLLSYLEFSRKIYKIIRTNNYDLIHVLNPQSYFLIPRPKKSKLLVVDHNTFYEQYRIGYGKNSFDIIKRKIFYLFFSIWEKKLCNMSDKIISVSDSTKEHLKKYYNISDDKIITIFNGIDHSKFHSIKPDKKFRKNLIFVGRLIPRKNILELIEIMAMLIKIESNIKLLIIGKGDKDYIKIIKFKIHKMGLEKNVILEGSVSDEKLNKLYSKSGIFVFPSLVEGFGLVLLEAMSKGLPIVAYNIPGVKDVVRNNREGFLINNNNKKDFAEKIIMLINDNILYEKLSKYCLQRVKDFSWNKSAKEIFKIYFTLLENEKL